MPSRNIVKIQAPDSFYHVYFRGSSKQKIFLESSDYSYFTHLLQRYLAKKQSVSKTGVPYPNYYGDLNLNAYCLMINHVHMLIHQTEIDTMATFMKSLIVSYTRYFNLKYSRSGKLFESTYKAARIDSDAYLHHITRYIHLNPRRWQTYRQSSLQYYRDGNEPEWLTTKPILGMFSSRRDYISFVSDYESMRDELSDIKHQLADQ